VKFQKDIMVVSRPTLKDSWGDRCIFLSREYNAHKHYNHRSILSNEVVIEFDDNDANKNREYADEVARRLKLDNISFSKWFSGNKSVHIHFFIDVGQARNISLLKNTIMRYYTKDLPLPDLRLSTPNHLVRAEYGKHEKTGNIKSFISCNGKYPEICKLPKPLWDYYVSRQITVIKRKVSTDVNQLSELEGFKYIVSSHMFREVDDGRERAMFMLIHVLKPKYKDRKDEFIKFMQDWYKYSGGRQLTDLQIERKVNYHWNREYNFTEKYLYDLLESIGKTDLIPNEFRENIKNE